MSIRLIKISKDLNVGISTITDFLQAKGFDVESNPNVKVSNDQFEMVVREFGKEADVEAMLNRKKAAAKKASTPKEEVSEVAVTPEVQEIESEKKDTKKQEAKAEKAEADVIEIIVPESKKPQIQIVDKIDLDAINGKGKSKPQAKPVVKAEVKKEEPKKKEEVKPKAEKPQVKAAAPKKEEVKAPEKKEPVEVKKPEEKEVVAVEVSPITVEPAGTTEDGIFRPTDTTLKSNIVVKGTIDLDAINDRTRPARKTRAERRKEREDRESLDPKKVKDANVRLTKTETDEEKKAKAKGEEDEPKKRRRIKRGRVDIQPGASQPAGAGAATGSGVNPPVPRVIKAKPIMAGAGGGGGRRTLNKPAVSDEDVQKQIKETLARLTTRGRGGRGKGAKYRKEKREAQSQRQQEEHESQEREKQILKITEFVTVSDLANMMDVAAVQVISTCMSIGVMVSINQRLDAETINIVAEEFGFQTEYVSAEVIEAISEEVDEEKDLETRAPIVTVMGHVDHGKTSLLDNIRQANVIAGEAGGITQHIGAYNVKMKSGRRITFLDTPGHEAFTAMRARGAQVTDVAIIIIAADDNVMPQTIEAINHAAAAGVPIVFAINKVDKPAANPDKIKEALAAMNYLVEEWGGKYQSQDISAKQGMGVDELLEKVLLEADMLDLKANPNRRANGSVIESSLDKGRGYLSTVMVQNGTLNVGDVIIAGTFMGRVKALFNERNQNVNAVPPASPAVILGLNGAPQAGDAFNVLESEQEAREIAGKREQLQREQMIRTQKILTLDDIGRRIAIGNFQQLNVIVKGDVDGSVEALSDSLLNLSTEEIQVNVIHKGVGQISESDVTLATASDAIIIGFQVRPSPAARRHAEDDGIDIRLYSIIYDAIEEVRAAMEGMLSPEIREELTGYVEVRDVFKITKVGTVAGCMVKEGKLKRANKIRLIRDGIVIYSGELGSLKRFKDDVKEVTSGFECGLNIHNYNDIKIGDIIEPFEEIEVKKKL